jgi:hypothetical protein
VVGLDEAATSLSSAAHTPTPETPGWKGTEMPMTQHQTRSPQAAGVAYLRARLGLSRSDLAAAMADRGHPWAYQTVSNIENDR